MEVVVKTEDCDRCADAIVKAARTGKIGDGKIFITSVERIVRIRTGEEDESAFEALEPSAGQRLTPYPLVMREASAAPQIPRHSIRARKTAALPHVLARRTGRATLGPMWSMAASRSRCIEQFHNHQKHDRTGQQSCARPSFGPTTRTPESRR